MDFYLTRPISQNIFTIGRNDYPPRYALPVASRGYGVVNLDIVGLVVGKRERVPAAIYFRGRYFAPGSADEVDCHRHCQGSPGAGVALDRQRWGRQERDEARVSCGRGQVLSEVEGGDAYLGEGRAGYGTYGRLGYRLRQCRAGHPSDVEGGERGYEDERYEGDQ